MDVTPAVGLMPAVSLWPGTRLKLNFGPRLVLPIGQEGGSAGHDALTAVNQTPFELPGLPLGTSIFKAISSLKGYFYF